MKTSKNAKKTSKKSHVTSSTETAMKSQTKTKTPTSAQAIPATHAPIAAAYPTTPPADMPPTVGVPATPKDWKARPAKGRGATRGVKLTKDQVTSAAAA